MCLQFPSLRQHNLLCQQYGRHGLQYSGAHYWERKERPARGVDHNRAGPPALAWPGLAETAERAGVVWTLESRRLGLPYRTSNPTFPPAAPLMDHSSLTPSAGAPAPAAPAAAAAGAPRCTCPAGRRCARTARAAPPTRPAPHARAAAARAAPCRCRQGPRSLLQRVNRSPREGRSREVCWGAAGSTTRSRVGPREQAAAAGTPSSSCRGSAFRRRTNTAPQAHLWPGPCPSLQPNLKVGRSLIMMHQLENLQSECAPVARATSLTVASSSSRLIAYPAPRAWMHLRAGEAAHFGHHLASEHSTCVPLQPPGACTSCAKATLENSAALAATGRPTARKAVRLSLAQPPTRLWQLRRHITPPVRECGKWGDQEQEAPAGLTQRLFRRWRRPSTRGPPAHLNECNT